MPAPKLSELVDTSLVADLKSDTKQEALNELIDLICRSPKITDCEAFRDAILSREELTSTGIGLSVAVPHAKIAAVTDYVLAIGRKPAGLEFDSLDKQPAKLIFMVGASDRQAVEFVGMLAQIVNLIKDGAVRVRLLEAQTAEDICQVIRDAEA